MPAVPPRGGPAIFLRRRSVTHARDSWAAREKCAVRFARAATPDELSRGDGGDDGADYLRHDGPAGEVEAGLGQFIKR